MLDTLLDSTAGSRARFVLEAFSLARFGLKARSTQTKGTSARQLATDSFRIAAVWLMGLLLTSDLGARIRGPIPDYPQYLYAPWTLALLFFAFAMALIGYERLAGATALLFVVSILVDPGRYDLTNAESERLVVPIVCFSVLVIASGRRRPKVRRLAWVAFTAMLAAASGTSDDPMAFVAILALIFLVPVSVAMIRINPRPAIACGLCAAYFGTHMAQDRGGPGAIGLVCLAAAPFVLAVVMMRAARRKQAPTPV